MSMKTLNNIHKEILPFKSELISLRRDFHKYPERGFEEIRTSGIVERYLKKLNIPTKRLAKTGIIGTLKGGKKCKVVALRADMDAIAVTEENTFDYKSTKKGTMHACGHDAHTAILLCAAKYFAQRKKTLKGTIRFIFQPCEETFGGAEPMIKKGCLKNPDVDVIFALHLWGLTPIGKILLTEGAIMATTSEIKIKIIGKGGHGAAPQHSIDSIVVASNFISSLQTIISRNLNPFENGVVTIGTINGGSAHNVIAPSVEMKGTLRALKDVNMNLLKKRVLKILDGVCKSFGAKYEYEFVKGYPTVVNDKNLVKFSKDVLKDFIGEKNIGEARSMGGEDFSFYAKKVPGCFIFVGAGNTKKGVIYPHHHPKFNIDENSMLIGMEILTRLTEKYLNN